MEIQCLNERERDRVRRVVCEVGNPRKSRSGSVRALDPQNSKSVRGKRECACVSSEEVMATLVY